LFTDLQIQAQQRLDAISMRLTGLAPVKTGMLSFSVLQLINSPDILLQSASKFSDRKLPYIYILSTTESINLDRIRAAFSTAKAQEKNDRAYARLNIGISPCFYVGSSYDILKRFKEHIGYGAKSTYALHLSHWAQDFPLLELSLHYAQYREGTPQDLLQSLEDALWEQRNPMFGRKGSK